MAYITVPKIQRSNTTSPTVEEFNALLTKLKAAEFMVAD